MTRTSGTTLDPGTPTPVTEPPAAPIEPPETPLDTPPVHPVADFAVRARTRLDHLTSPPHARSGR